MKMYQQIGLAAAVVCAGSVTANAGWVSLQLPYADYGHVYNTDNGMANGNPIGYCAPTATANSFVFLEKYYPNIYGGNPLSGGNAIALRNSLATGWWYNAMWRNGMYNPITLGSSDQDWWDYKVQYIDDFAPNTTIYKCWTTDNTLGWLHPEDITAAFPTWGNLWTEISDGEDVEIKIYAGDMDQAHALTLTSMSFLDANGNGTWDPGEQRMIDYLDPNNPTQLFAGNVFDALDGGKLEFHWSNGGANNPADVDIYMALSESPVPEPSLLSLLALGLLLAMRRRHAA